MFTHDQSGVGSSMNLSGFLTGNVKPRPLILNSSMTLIAQFMHNNFLGYLICHICQFLKISKYEKLLYLYFSNPQELQWLSISFKIEYKLLLLAFLAHFLGGPTYGTYHNFSCHILQLAHFDPLANRIKLHQNCT